MGVLPKVLRDGKNYDGYTGEYICKQCHKWTGSGEDDCACRLDETDNGAALNEQQPRKERQ